MGNHATAATSTGHRARALLWLVAGLCVACGATRKSSPSEQSDGGEGNTAAAAGGSDSGAAFQSLRECPAARPCPAVVSSSGEVTRPPDSEALRCVLLSLRDRVPGIYSRQHELVSALPTLSTETLSLVTGDGEVRSAVQSINNGAVRYSSPEHCSLRPPEDYAACLGGGAGGTTGDLPPGCDTLEWFTACRGGDVECP